MSKKKKKKKRQKIYQKYQIPLKKGAKFHLMTFCDNYIVMILYWKTKFK